MVNVVLSPAEAADYVMDRFRPYLPERERFDLGKLVEELMREWGEEQHNKGAEEMY
jgi:hypothetical protein